MFLRAARRCRELIVVIAILHDGLSVRSEVGIANDVGMELLRIAEHNHVELIVIATHGVTGWNNFVFGSVAEKVVRQANVPVLVLRFPPDSKR